MQLQWAPIQHGIALASGHSNGVCLIHHEAASGGKASIRQPAKLSGHSGPIAVLEFAPSSQGLCVATAAGARVRCTELHSSRIACTTASHRAGFVLNSVIRFDCVRCFGAGYLIAKAAVRAGRLPQDLMPEPQSRL